MGLVWTGECYVDPRDGNTYILHQRRKFRGTLTATQETAPGHGSKLTAQTYFNRFDGTLIQPSCSCTWEERVSGHVCTRRIWVLMERRARKCKNRHSR